MDTPQFSPGPWWPGHLGDPGSTCDCTSIVDEGHAGGIAHVHVYNGIRSIGDGGNDAPKETEAVANMHLIAAAPDLYAAVTAALGKQKCWREKARAALAKAHPNQT